MRRSRCIGAVLLVALCALVSGCGQAQQNAHEPRGNFTVQIVKASFPGKQAISRASRLKLEIRNAGASTIPNLAVTIDSFGYTSDYPGLASSERPVWIVNQGPGATPKRTVKSVPFNSPGNDVTATANTWTAGAVPAGQTRTFIWKVTPIKSGTHAITYTIAAGLNGKARAELGNGGIPKGRLTANIASAPPITHVNPNTGQIAPGPLPVGP